MHAQTHHPQAADRLTSASLLMVLGTILTWSSAFPAISFGLEHFTPGELSLGRFGVASLCFLLLVLLGIIRLPPLRHWPAIILLGGIGIAGYQLLLGYGMTRVAAGAASVLIGLILNPDQAADTTPKMLPAELIVRGSTAAPKS